MLSSAGCCASYSLYETHSLHTYLPNGSEYMIYRKRFIDIVHLLTRLKYPIEQCTAKRIRRVLRKREKLLNLY